MNENCYSCYDIDLCGLVNFTRGKAYLVKRWGSSRKLAPTTIPKLHLSWLPWRRCQISRWHRCFQHCSEDHSLPSCFYLLQQDTGRSSRSSPSLVKKSNYYRWSSPRMLLEVPCEQRRGQIPVQRISKLLNSQEDNYFWCLPAEGLAAKRMRIATSPLVEQ